MFLAVGKDQAAILIRHRFDVPDRALDRVMEQLLHLRSDEVGEARCQSAFLYVRIGLQVLAHLALRLLEEGVGELHGNGGVGQHQLHANQVSR